MPIDYSKNEKEIIIETVDLAIEHGLQHNKIIELDLKTYPANLIKHAACFITLEIDKKLRGCIGTLEAHQPLITDVSQNAFYAAFSDYRFPPVQSKEFKHLEKHVSILSEPEQMVFTSEDNLLQQLRPGIDGLILFDQGRRGTFLPMVWEQLPNPRQFLRQLKMKAGFPEDYWSATIKIERYTAKRL